MDGQKISELGRKATINGSELIPFAESNGNGAIATDTIVEAAKFALFREQWKVCGGVYNETTGFYEMNGLTDITYEQAKEIMYAPSSAPGFVSYVPKARTNIMPTRAIYGGGMYGTLADLSSICYNNTKIEVLALAHTNTKVQTNNIKCMCIWSDKLKKIIGNISCVNIANESGYTSAFQSCTALEEVWLQWWSLDIDLHWSPNLKMECVEYFVENRSGSNAIAMKLHPDAFARLTDELIAQAATKNITFIETA